MDVLIARVHAAGTDGRNRIIELAERGLKCTLYESIDVRVHVHHLSLSNCSTVLLVFGRIS